MTRLLVSAAIACSAAYLVARFLKPHDEWFPDWAPDPRTQVPIVFTSGYPDDSYPWPIGI